MDEFRAWVSGRGFVRSLVSLKLIEYELEQSSSPAYGFGVWSLKAGYDNPGSYQPLREGRANHLRLEFPYQPNTLKRMTNPPKPNHQII